MAIQATSAGSVRARSRVNQNSGPAAVAQNPGATADWMRAGAAAIQGHQEHQETVQQRREERQSQVGVPWRFFLAKGEEVDIVILDNDFGPGLFEHDLTNHDRFKRMNPKTGRPFDQFVTSPCQWETDPITQETGKEPYYGTFITIGVLKPYTNGKGQEVSYSRRLCCLKGEAMELLTTIRAQQIAQGHANAPLRGLHLLMKRGTSDQSLKTGLPMFVARVSEQDIMDTFGHPEVLGEKDGKLIKPANADCFPIDYAAAFPKPSADEIRKRFNLGQNTGFGSNGYSRGHFNDGGSQEHDGGGGTEGFDEEGGTNTEGFSSGDDYSSGFSTGRASGPKETYDLNDDIPF